MNKKLKLSVVIIVSSHLIPGCVHRGKGEEMKSDSAMRTGGGETRREAMDVCGFVDDVAPKSVGDGMVRIPPSHPDIRYTGRIDCRDAEALRMSHPGVSIRVRVESPSIELLLEDFGIEEYPNFYNVVIDNDDPVLLRVSPNEHRYVLANDLADGAHTVTLSRRGESCANGVENNGKGIFRGFIVPEGASVLPQEPRPRRIEFIGDSITCGYGNGIATVFPETHPYTTENSDATTAFGARIARALDAEYMAIAYSGRGIVRNYDSAPGKTIPEMYLDILPDDPDPGSWDIHRYTPELTVINLGTNDFSEGLALADLPDLRAAYERDFGIFVNTLRRYYPETVIILAVGPVLSNSWPKGYDALSSVRTILERIVAARNAGGDNNLHLFVHEPQTAPYGEDWHPSAERHRIMADELLDFIQRLGVFE